MTQVEFLSMHYFIVKKIIYDSLSTETDASQTIKSIRWQNWTIDSIKSKFLIPANQMSGTKQKKSQLVCCCASMRLQCHLINCQIQSVSTFLACRLLHFLWGCWLVYKINEKKNCVRMSLKKIILIYITSRVHGVGFEYCCNCFYWNPSNGLWLLSHACRFKVHKLERDFFGVLREAETKLQAGELKH